MTGFVKAMRTEESTFLDMHPNANHMLNVIARRARRTPCHLNKLEVGECFIGHKGLGLTERQYRTAKKQLEEWRMVEFKRGRKATDKGTVAKLLNTKVYDINEELGDGRKTDERRKGDGKATTNKECKNEKNEIIDLPVVISSQLDSLGKDDLTMVNYMIDTIKSKLPNFKNPNIKNWQNDIRLMRERDNRSHREMAETFKWASNDSFWSSNIMSPKKLREKFDQLQANMNKSSGSNFSSVTQKSINNIQGDW